MNAGNVKPCTRCRVRTHFDECARSLLRLGWPDRLLLIVLLGMIGGGVWLRLQQLGFPVGMSFDEFHFVENARNYLHGSHDWNDHPPLGKLLIGIGFLLFGDNSVGWRFAPAVCGLQTIALGYFVGSKLFSSRWAGLMAAAFFAADGFLTAYSRTALLDGMLLCFSLWTTLAIVHIRKWYHVAIAAVLLGLSCSIKVSASVLVVPLLVVILGFRAAPWWSLGLGILAPIVFGLLWSLGLFLAGEPHGLSAVINVVLGQLRHHASLTDWIHPLLSKWYTWPVALKPIMLRRDGPSDQLRLMTSLGNPLLWASVTVAMVIAPITVIVRGVRQRFAKGWLGNNHLLYGAMMAVLGWISFVVPWVVSRRDSYIYHYLVPLWVWIAARCGLGGVRSTHTPMVGVCGGVRGGGCVCSLRASVGAVTDRR